MEKPEKYIDKKARNEEGIVGIIRYWDEKREKFIGHQYEDNGKYWEAKEPQIMIQEDEENEKKVEDSD